MLHTFFYFFLALVLLITIHELGHFIVARLCGVKVLRFSFGFGKVLARWKDKRGTEFVWSAFPLGGYVKMLDEAEGEVPEALRHKAFNNQSVWVRIAIVIAGPLFNFLFAFLALWLMWVIGIKSLAPIISEVKPESIAARAGIKGNQEILSLNERTIHSWRDFQYTLMPLLGSDAPVTLTLQSLTDHSRSEVILPLAEWELDAQKPDILTSFGLVPFIPEIPPIVGEIVGDTPAEAAGLMPGDKITAIDGKPVITWLELVDYVQKHPGLRVVLEIMRNGEHKTVVINTGIIDKEGKKEGFWGVKSQKVDFPKHWLRLHQKGPIVALGTAFKQTLQLTQTTFSLIGRLIIGKLPIQSLSGPIGIAQGAGESARSGLSYYLSFLALVSISLGVLNLLPIPVLDGGHLLYCLLEIVRNKPLSEEAKSTGMYVGLLILMALMIISVSNDITRLTG